MRNAPGAADRSRLHISTYTRRSSVPTTALRRLHSCLCPHPILRHSVAIMSGAVAMPETDSPDLVLERCRPSSISLTKPLDGPQMLLVAHSRMGSSRLVLPEAQARLSDQNEGQLPPPCRWTGAKNHSGCCRSSKRCKDSLASRVRRSSAAPLAKVARSCLASGVAVYSST